MKNMRNAGRAVALLLVIVMVVLMGAGSQKSDPSVIHIRNSKDLMELSEACKYDAYSRDLTVILDKDIDLTGEAFVPIPTFGGTFDGKSHTISGLSLSGDGAHMGLFRYIQAGGTVQNLNVSGTVDSAGTLTEIGAIVGTNMGTVTGCNFSGSISGKNNVGGIAGTNEATGMIYNCKSEGFVAGDHYVGGTVGQNLGTVSYCSNTAGVNVNTEDISVETIDEISLSDDEEEGKAANTSTDVGGIVGFSSGVVIGCTNWGTIGFQHVGYNIGGIVGRQSGLVTGCTNWGTALGRKDVGGIVGQMEPYIELDSGAGSIGKMEQDLNTLHDQMNVLLGHTGAAASDMSATLGSISASAGRATEHARVVAERTMDYVDETSETVDELLIRINTSEKMVAPAIAEFSQGSVQLETATGYFSNGFDYLDAIDEMTDADKSSFKSSANDLTTSADKLNASMAYLGWLMKAADNAYGTGNYDLEAERPDSWEHDAEEYGYEYNPAALSNYESIRDAMLRGAGDASGAAGAISGDVSTMTKVINTYYLTEDADGKTRLDNMSDAFKSAFDSLKQSTAHLSTGMSYLDQMASYLSGNDALVMPSVDSDYRTEMEGMFDELSAISAGLSRLATQTANYSNLIISDMRAVNDTFNIVMLDLCDILQLALDPDGKDIIEDVSEEDYETATTGKVYSCQNYGTADGDVAVGGIVGTMAIEYDFDPESDSTILSETSLTSKYFTKCVLMDSTNYGTSVSRKDYSGGICGEADLGVIVGCQGYGTAESTLGSYVGGIVGMSKGSVRDSYAKCELTGENYVGGVAGYGKNITGCSTLMNLNADGNCVGTIAGELDGEGTISDNYFVHESAAGVDGISYEGKAEALSYEDFMKREGVPAEFSSFTATFTANGEVVKTIVFAYGASIDESEIPECPVVEGNYGRWPDFDYTNLTFDVEIRAEYTASASSVSGNLLNDDGTPVVILEGVFDPAAKAVVTKSTVEGPSITGDRNLIAKYDVRVENDSLAEDADRAVKVRVHVPKGGSYNVYTHRDGRWDSVSYTRDGSYIVFEQPNRDITFAVTQSRFSPLLYILAGLALLALIVCVIRLLRKRKRRKTAEAEAAVVDSVEPVGSETKRFEGAVEDEAPETEEMEPVVEETSEAFAEEIPASEESSEASADELPAEEETTGWLEEDLPETEASESEAAEEPVAAEPVKEADDDAFEVENSEPEHPTFVPEVETEEPVIADRASDVERDSDAIESAAPVAGAAAGGGILGFFSRRRKNKKSRSDAAKAAEEEPVVEVEEPVVEVEEPVVEVEEPVVEVEEPVVEVEEPVAEVEAPVVEVEEPVVEVEEPVVEVEEPVVEVEEPVVEVEEPVAEVEEPVAEVEEPVVEAEEPAVEAEEPVEEPVQKQKRGLFSFLRRKSKKNAAPVVDAVEAEAPVVVPVEVPEITETPIMDDGEERTVPEAETPEVETEVPETVDAVVDPVAEEVAKLETASLDDLIADIRASIGDLPEETPAVAVEVPEAEEIPTAEPVEAEAPVAEAAEPIEEPAVEEIPLVAVPYVEETPAPVAQETPIDTSSLDDFIASVRASVSDLPTEAPVADEVPPVAVPYVEETPAEEPVVDEVPLVAVPYVEETPAEEPEFDEVPLVAVPYVEETPAEEPVVDEVPLVAVPYVEETPAEEPVVDEVPLVAVPYVEETPAEEPEFDEVPLVAVPYVEETKADTSSLDDFIASIRASVSEIPTQAPAAEPVEDEEDLADEAEEPVADTTSLDELIAKVRLSVSEISFVDETPIADPVPVGDRFESLEAHSTEILASAEEAQQTDTTSLDDFIASIRSSVADIPVAEPVTEPAPAESTDSLDALIAQVRATVADVTAEPTTESLDDVIDFVKDTMPDDAE